MTFAPMRFGAQPWSESSCQPHTRHPSGARGPTRSEMAARLVELHRVLKPTGSLYLHSDPTASRYLKIVLDAIFGPAQFINEIAWKRTGAHSSANRYGPNFDTLLFYAKGSAWTWNQHFGPYDDHYVRECPLKSGRFTPAAAARLGRAAHSLGAPGHPAPAGPLALGDHIQRRPGATAGDPAPRLTSR